MENASKALIMAGGILIGVIVLSIGAYLFTNFREDGREIQQQIDTRVIAEFNSNFIKYQGSSKCTIHDIVNLAKFARKTNDQMNLVTYTANNFYIKVCLNNANNDLTKKTETELTTILESNSIYENTKDGKKIVSIKYYTCTDITFIPLNQSNRVKTIVFKENSDNFYEDL